MDSVFNTPSPWQGDLSSPHQAYFFSLKDVLFRHHSSVQKIEIVDSHVHGRGLLLDGVTQCFENDEYIFHECLVHPAALSCEKLNTVAILGGGDGGSAREILKHPSIQTIDLVEWDQELVQACQNHLPTIHNGSFNHPKVTIHIADAFQFLKHRHASYDLILVDLTDEVQNSTQHSLFSDEKMQIIRKSLAKNGRAAFHCGPLYTDIERLFRPAITLLRRNFKHLSIGSAHIPSFSDLWSFVSASEAPRALSAAHHLPLRYLDQETLQNFLSLPQPARNLLHAMESPSR